MATLRGERVKGMDREAAEKALIKLAQHSAAAWQRIRGEAFLGQAVVETSNTLYRFENGVLRGRAPKASANDPSIPWELPPEMEGLELIGFLGDEGGLWSLSPRWRPGSLAVLWAHGKRAAPDKPASDAFTLTSPTEAFRIDRGVEEASWPMQLPDQPDVFARKRRGPPTVHRPEPPSMTRLQPMPSAR